MDHTAGWDLDQGEEAHPWGLPAAEPQITLPYSNNALTSCSLKGNLALACACPFPPITGMWYLLVRISHRWVEMGSQEKPL